MMHIGRTQTILGVFRPGAGCGLRPRPPSAAASTPRAGLQAERRARRLPRADDGLQRLPHAAGRWARRDRSRT